MSDVRRLVAAFMSDQLAQDDAELEKAKEVIANGYGHLIQTIAGSAGKRVTIH